MHRRGAFRDACRHGWQRGAPKPTVKASAEARQNLDTADDVSHVGIARKLIAQLDEYEEHCQSYLEGLDHEDFAVDDGDEDVAMEDETVAGEDENVGTEHEEVVSDDTEEMDEWEGVVGFREDLSDDQDEDF